jgi:FemAB-related protein (PEP-CTERM system-associated)
VDIIHCTDSDARRWDDFVASCSEGSFYHRYAWRAINEKCFGHESYYLAAVDGGEIRGLFPLVLLRSRIFGKILCSMPFVNLGGPCTSDPVVSEALMGEATRLLSWTGAKFLEVRARSRLKTSRPPSEHKVSMTIELAEDPDKLWKAFTSKHRNNVRRAYGHGFSTVNGGPELVDACYEVLTESWRSLGTPLYAKAYFSEVARIFNDSIAIFLVLQDGRPVGTAFNGHHLDRVEGMWAGTAAAFRGSDLNYVLYWDMIQHYCRSGFKRFHLGRSSADSGAEAFKKKWLASSTQLYWHQIAAPNGRIPQLNVNNPKFQLAIRTWKRLPLALTKTIGPVISKGIP